VTDHRDGVAHEVGHDDDPGVTEDELLFRAEGGSAYACRRAGHWLVVTEEFALDDYDSGRVVRRFPTEQARDDFLRDRDWPLPANLACERARPDVAKVIDIRAVLLRIDGAYATGMDDVDVYAATRAYWPMGVRRQRAHVALAVADDVVRGVYSIHEWQAQPVANDAADVINNSVLWTFTGEPEAELRHLIGLDVSGLFNPATQNRVAYINC